jgi:hypothetical protein
MKAFTSKIKITAFRGKEPIRTKTAVDNKILEQVRDFSYEGKFGSSVIWVMTPSCLTGNQYMTTQCYNPDDDSQHFHCHENLRFHESFSPN